MKCVRGAPLDAAFSASPVRWACIVEQSGAIWLHPKFRATGHRNDEDHTG
jgi:hypothetical protein